MYTKTWEFGTNKELDRLFEIQREIQYQDQTHPLWRNYAPIEFADCSAVSITFVDDKPFFCSSIIKRVCWPDKVYRVLNRLWKPHPRLKALKRISPELGSMLHSQIEWLSLNTDYKLIFVSRQTDNWQQWTIDNFSQYFNLDFYSGGDYKYITYGNPDDPTCWQRIIYSGDESLLLSWERK